MNKIKDVKSWKNQFKPLGNRKSPIAVERIKDGKKFDIYTPVRYKGEEWNILLFEEDNVQVCIVRQNELVGEKAYLGYEDENGDIQFSSRDADGYIQLMVEINDLD